MKRLLVALLLAVVTAVSGSAAADIPTVVHDGHPYVDLARIATELKARTDAKPGAINAELRSGGQVVRFTRNLTQVVVDGVTIVLDAPVRVKDGRWLIPRSFVNDVMPRLLAAAPAAEAASPRTAAAPVTVTLDEMRVRSYPTFTRVVLETSTAVTHRVEGAEGGTLRVRVPGLSGRARSEDV